VDYRLSSTAQLLTIDVVEWYRDPVLASALKKRNTVEPDRTPQVVGNLLRELDSAGARATFFIDAGTATRHGDVVRAIVRHGHEVGALGDYVGDDWDVFRADARRVKDVLDRIPGVGVRGFRSPFSPLAAPWRFPMLVDEGYEYDSTRVAVGAVPSYAQTQECTTGWLIEVPLMASPFGSTSLSVRDTSYGAMHRAFAGRARSGLPGVISFATWEIDDEEPRQRLPLLAAFRHYRGRRAARERVQRLLRDFRFDAIGYQLSELAKDAPAAYAA
jgi:hypothetical protein